MRLSRQRSGLGLVVLAAVIPAALAACAEPYKDPPLPPGVVEIPVTTRSSEALERFRRGEAFQDIGHSKRANPIFENATGKDPRFTYAYLNAAYTAASVQELNEHLKLAKLYLEGKSEGERLLVEIAQTYLDDEAEKRLQLAEQLVEIYPQSRRAWLTLAQVHRARYEHEAARESMARALELDPDFIATNVAIFRSYLYSEPKDFARAEEAMLKCLEIVPEVGKLHENLADVYRAMNRLEEARERYAQAAETDPELPAALVKRAHVTSYLGDFEQARMEYDEAIEGARDQSQIEYANYRAFTHLHAGDFSAAIDDLAPLLDEVGEIGLPRDQVAAATEFTLSNLAAIQLHHGLLDDAEATLTELAEAHRSIARQSESPHVVSEREGAILAWEARLAARTGDFQLAASKAEEHRQAMQGTRNLRRDESYWHLRGLIELLQGNHPQAALHLQKANLHDVYAKFQLAEAMAGAGDLEEAKRLFREVATSNFNTVGFALVRGAALERSS